MLKVPSDTRSSTSPSWTPRPGLGWVLPAAPSDHEPGVEPPGTAVVSQGTEKGWRLKLAVLLVVAVLCIAFAGLLWALIF